ncbi:16S rRNA (guanine(966)-N(2))-methyltransferase RsmD [Parafrigoribacterium mesophilum]|uniref:16S rRNA (guanine(966)-N(2))-methyltransferase RsmD n=1 Tax=Parafrigoribacterium mesophilum TaxID=433646 RepID=UPI0031FD6545
MTRIIAGFAGSLALKVPGRGTRPTSDRVREAIFSALDARGVIAGARVLDLYAGSGALGLEAASRGARAVTLVERAPAAAAACRANAATLRRNAPEHSIPGIEVIAQSVQSFLASASSTWDIVFLDPPYDLPQTELAAALTALAGRLAPDATLMLERSSRSSEPVWPEGITGVRRKNYGDTTLWWARADGQPEANNPEAMTPEANSSAAKSPEAEG